MAELKAPPQQFIFQEQKPLLAHTALSIVGTAVLFVPALLLFGLVAQFLRWWHLEALGDKSLGPPAVYLEDITMHGLQYWFATYAALAIPHTFLDRANTLIVCSVIGTVLAILSVAYVITGFFIPSGLNPTVLGGFVTAAEIIGVFAALIYFHFQHR